MVYLVSDGLACGVAQVPEVRTPFTSLAEAQAQAEHDGVVGRTPLRIEDGETGEILWEPQAIRDSG
jgi:hypothetical protein